MSLHRATVRWQSTAAPFAYETYSRAHAWHFEGGTEIKASAAPAYQGDPSLVDPEEAFVASLASCHLLTFLAIAARDGFVVTSYEDEAEGTLAKNEAGRLAITRVVLQPRISFGGTAPSEEALERMHARAHAGCLIANSVRTDVVVEPR